MSRAFVVVLDACGAGALPDAADYGDEGTNTLAHLAERVRLHLPALAGLGLGSILELRGVAPAAAPVMHGRLHALGPGKDSTAGHWELMGIVAPARMPTYPDGFPEPVIALVEAASGRGVLCNRPSNGLEAVERFGAEHVRTGAADRLHEPGLGASDRRSRRCRGDRGAVRDLRAGPCEAPGRALGRAGDRAPVRRPRRGLDPH